jgi:cell division topological specificity factor
MSRRFLDLFRNSSKATAAVAKERLQIIVAQQRRQGGMPDFLPRLQNDILEVIRRYVTVEDDAVDIQIDRADGGCEILELNITLPEEKMVAIEARI